METVYRNSASPTPIRTVEEQLSSLFQRRSVIDRLIRTLELYQRMTPLPVAQKKTHVA